MPRPKTSRKKAELTGQIRNHPSRFANRGNAPVSNHVGGPPDYLGEVEKAAWHEFVSAWPSVSKSDEAALALLCVVHGKVQDPTVESKASMLSAYRLLLADFGGTPTSRNRIDWEGETEEENPFAKFEN